MESNLFNTSVSSNFLGLKRLKLFGLRVIRRLRSGKDRGWATIVKRWQLQVNLDLQSKILETSEVGQLGMVQIATVRHEWDPERRKINCLLLGPGSREGTHRRIGLVEIPDVQGFNLTPWEMREVLIV